MAEETKAAPEKEPVKTALSASETPEKKHAEPRRDGGAEPGGNTRLAKANRRGLMAEAKLAAVSLGVPAARAPYAAKLADLSGVPVDEDDGPDLAAVKSAVKKVLADIPELKANAAAEKAPGLRIGANNSASQNTDDPLKAGRVKPWNKFRL